jgi:hypothetical protein
MAYDINSSILRDKILMGKGWLEFDGETEIERKNECRSGELFFLNKFREKTFFAIPLVSLFHPVT